MSLHMTRRGIIQFCAGVAAAGPRIALADEAKPGEFRIGIASYSFREFQRKMTISMIKQLGVRYVSVKEFHLPYSLSAAEAAKAAAEFSKAGLTIVSGGNISLTDEDPAALKRLFQYAKSCGMPMMGCPPAHKTLPTVQNLPKNFIIKIAIPT